MLVLSRAATVLVLVIGTEGKQGQSISVGFRRKPLAHWATSRTGPHRALGHIARWAKWRQQPQGETIRPGGIDAERGREIVRQACARGGADRGDSFWMTTGEATKLLDAYGVPLAQNSIVTDTEAAADAQREIGAPVAVKIDAPIHKTDVGGVVLGCETPEEAAEAVEKIEGSLKQTEHARYIGSYLVQEMVGEGVQLAVGVHEDPSFGPVLMVGLGGDFLELLSDISVRLTPFSDREAKEMLESLKSYPLLSGYRGQPAKDIEALLDLIHRVGALVEDVEEVAELDLNPVFVKTNGVIAADVRLRLRLDSA